MDETLEDSERVRRIEQIKRLATDGLLSADDAAFLIATIEQFYREAREHPAV